MNGPSFFRFVLILPVCLVLGSCSRAAPPMPEPLPVVAAVEKEPEKAPLPLPEASHPFVRAEDRDLWEALHKQGLDKSSIATRLVNENWRDLLDHLRADGLVGEEMILLFARLDVPSQDPMGRKVQELYTGKYLRKPKSPSSPDLTPSETGIPKPWYKGFVTDANARRCRTFINTHSRWFAEAEAAFGVPTEVAAALLFVETRLGDYLGEQNAFITLSSMAVSRSPEAIPDWLQKLPGAEKRLEWITLRMQDKADWAYAELKALLVYSMENGIDPFEVPSSSYGAVGLCQFMPSNISRFALDGNNDGIIDLFDPPDAVASLSHYLYRHGWKSDIDIPAQIKVLRRYNNLGIYANTILALAEKIKGIPGRPVVRRDFVHPLDITPKEN